MKYPETRVDDTEDVLAGVSFPDPYRWLEEETGDVREWQRAQAQLASAHVREWPHFDRLRKLVARFSTDQWHRGGVVPRYAGGKWFRTRVADGATQAQVLVTAEPLGEGRVLFDPIKEDSERPQFVSWIAPSPDGCILALGICSDGSENNTIRLIDVATGGALKDPPAQMLMDGATGGVQWLSDSSGFFFSAITGAAVAFEQKVYLHRRFPTPNTIPVDIAWTEVRDYRWVVVARDGRHAVAFERFANTIPVAVTALGEGPLRWRPFVTRVSGRLTGHLVGKRFIAVTEVDAPRGRLVSIDVDSEDPNDPKGWQELVSESHAVLQTITPVGQFLYLTELVNTYTRVRILDLNGKHLGEVPLPGQGAAGVEWLDSVLGTLPKGHPDRFLFTFSSLTQSPGIYAHTPNQEEIETLEEPQVRLEDVLVEDRWAVSADGTRIPYHLVRQIDADASQPQPTLIYGYGAFNAPWVPRFPGPMAALIASGAVFVHAHLRGGGEFGFEWWEGGRKKNKQNSFDDLYAIAEDLIVARRCRSESLAVMGGSAGGLMAAAALTQRPDLWKVVVARVPILDLIGACRTPYSLMCTLKERANVADPDEVRRLATFSPYHLVREGVRYPATFLDAGETDPRCPPWHARKFAARLQRATEGTAPILLHVWESVGHGGATARDIAVAENTEWIAFTLRHLGLGDRI